MAEFNVLKYKKHLRRSRSCNRCKKVPASKLGANSRYIFISYSHKDYKKVYSDLADLYESGIPFWYDEGLPVGKNWDDVVREKMTDTRCVGIIFYLSENLFISRSIQTEICIACGEDGDSNLPKIKRDYFCVNLTDKSPSQILKSVYSKKEFSDTEDEMDAQNAWNSILTKAFPDKATYLKFDSPCHKENLVEQTTTYFGIGPNYNPYDFGSAISSSGTINIKFKNGSAYKGDFQNGLFHGQGTMFYSDQSVYEGEWCEGKRHGQGKTTYSDGSVYEGEWREGKMHGYGKLTHSKGIKYEGEWLEGKRHGQGKTTYSNGSVYEGEWRENKWNGYGKLTFSDGSVYEGEWLEDKMHGYGKVTFSSGSVYEGEWVNGKFHGHGKYTSNNGVVYEGELVDGKFHGHGKYTSNNGVVYEGEWLEDKMHGYGTLTLSNGTKLNGRFENGDFVE